jgi:DNA-binding MarR family transcriptional regulator
MNNNFNLNESLGFLISITNASMKAFFGRAIKKNGIEATVEQWGLLNIVKESPGIIQNDIAGKSMKDKTNVTRMLDLLEKNQYIERRNDRNDRRLYRIYITEKGESLLKELVPIALSTNEKATYGLRKDELKTFTEILYKIYNNTREL